MKIRSITYFCNPGWPLREKVLRAAGDFLSRARAACQAAGYEVQTTRLATIPFPRLLGTDQLDDLPALAAQIMAAAREAGIAYVSLGPALPDLPRSYAVIPEALAATQDVFFAGEVASASRAISTAAARACAEVMLRAAPLEPDGFANLRFAALANVPAGSPFFPAAYAGEGGPVFAIATEAADLAVAAFAGALTVDEARANLILEIEKHAAAIVRVCRGLERSLRARFGGMDFSLAPFPEEARSLGAAFERLGVPAVGLHGSLTAAAILTGAIEQARFPRAGFSGLMLPVLEDATLARRAAEGTLTVKDLLLYSAVCGTGLDTIPLPGDVTADQITALLLDLTALALRLDKPLTARLMPVPGKQAGDPTGFDFAFFANSRVMWLDAGSLQGALAGEQVFQIKPRR